jgi:tRNA wybutosine-synthesizing protein 1
MIGQAINAKCCYVTHPFPFVCAAVSPKLVVAPPRPSSESEEEETDEEEGDEEDSKNVQGGGDEGVTDIEDMAENGCGGPRAGKMVTPVIRKSLEKQGYTVVGSHSGVKLCRWTKAMLRGRGGCYKHTFYGIESHRCMEATPSLACANKCVFCWRHHTNPTGTSWVWEKQPPGEILDGCLR